jgi:hypothetical protein
MKKTKTKKYAALYALVNKVTTDGTPQPKDILKELGVLDDAINLVEDTTRETVIENLRLYDFLAYGLAVGIEYGRRNPNKVN